MRYKLAPIFCRPWTLNGLTLQLIESHYENNYGGGPAAAERHHRRARAARRRHGPRLPARRAETRRARRPQLHAAARALLREPGRRRHQAHRCGGGGPHARLRVSFQRWKDEFLAMGYALGGGSGWVLLTWVPRDGRLVNQYASEHTQAIGGRDPDPRARHVRACVPYRLRRERPRLRRDLHAQHRLAGRGRALAGCARDRRAAPVDAAGIRRRAGRGARGGEGDAGRGAVRAGDRRAATPLVLARDTDIMDGAVWRDPDRVAEWSGR